MQHLRLCAMHLSYTMHLRDVAHAPASTVDSGSVFQPRGGSSQRSAGGALRDTAQCSSSPSRRDHVMRLSVSVTTTLITACSSSRQKSMLLHGLEHQRVCLHTQCSSMYRRQEHVMRLSVSVTTTLIAAYKSSSSTEPMCGLEHQDVCTLSAAACTAGKSTSWRSPSQSPGWVTDCLCRHLHTICCVQVCRRTRAAFMCMHSVGIVRDCWQASLPPASRHCCLPSWNCRS
jgi:hypothetical protein